MKEIGSCQMISSPRGLSVSSRRGDNLWFLASQDVAGRLGMLDPTAKYPWRNVRGRRLI